MSIEEYLEKKVLNQIRIHISFSNFENIPTIFEYIRKIYIEYKKYISYNEFS